MLHSMTGFGGAQGLVKDIEYAIEVRSVNSRYFKSVIKLPESLSALENVMEGRLRERLSRGSITTTVRMRLSESQLAYRVNTVALRSYLEQLRELEFDANPSLRIELGSLLQLPGVCEPPLMEELAERTRQGLMDLLDQAIDGVILMRKQEGKALCGDLLGHCELIERMVLKITELAPQMVVSYQQRLAGRVKELLNAGNVSIDTEQLAREVAIFAERCDIAEEISRMGGHVVQFCQAIDTPEPSGRKLDFIAQEMLREANTIASKANISEIVHAVVEIKTAVDRIKEQVQNVE